MKKLIAIQVLAMLIVIGGIFFSSGCGRACGGDLVRGFPTKWTEAKIPIVEGAVSICKTKPEPKVVLTEGNSSNKTDDISILTVETTAYLTYENTSYLDMHKKYEQKYTGEGWKFETTYEGRMPVAKVSKDEIKATIVFSGTCGTPGCASVGFYAVSRNNVIF